MGASNEVRSLENASSWGDVAGKTGSGKYAFVCIRRGRVGKF